MGMPVVIVDSGGLAVTESTNGIGTPVTISQTGYGMPVTLVDSGGMSVIGAAAIPTNLLQASSDFDRWTASGVTVDYNVAQEPVRLDTRADRMTEIANLSQHQLTSVSMNFVLGTTYTFSIYVKYESTAFIQLLLGSAAFGSNAWANFNIQTGVLGTVGSAATARVVAARNGWYRISITAPATATAASTAVLFGADASTMTRASSYTGSTSNTRLLANSQIEVGSTPGIYVPYVPTIVGNTDDAIVGALRWDAWFHPTQDTIRTAVETSLGPLKYKSRLPFFAEKPTDATAVIAGTQADMDAEIGYAVEAGLDYWAFFWYGVAASNGMDTGWDYYQASPDKYDINWCLYFSGITPFHDDVTNYLSTVVGYMQQINYQKTASGRPLVFMYDDAAARTNLAADITAFRAAVTGAGLSDPYIIFQQSTADATVITTYGFNATTTYAPVVSVTGAKPYSLLDTTARAKWAAQATKGVDVVPSFTLGWDRRPRVDNPVPWETPSGSLSDYYYLEYQHDVSVHLDACLAWARANPARTPHKIIIGYAWNENDEGGWIVPTLKPSGRIDKRRLNGVKAVLAFDPEAQGYDPVTALGAKLIAYWDANRGDTLTVVSSDGDDNAVTAWADIVAGYSAIPADVASRPAYLPTGLSGAPCLNFDTTQYLTCTDAGLLAALPDGAEPSEMWVVLSQDALPADTTERYAVAYGGSSITTGRGISRIVTTGVNRTRSRTGTGAAATNISDTAVDFSGVHVIRQIVGATSSSLEIDGGTASSAAAVPSTTNSRLRIGSISASGVSNNWNGKIAAVLVTTALTEDEAVLLHRYLG